MTPDPYKASGGPTDPGSWNRYAYTAGDPVNRHDPRGLLYTFGCDDYDVTEGDPDQGTEGCVNNAFFSDFGGPVGGPLYYQPQKNPSNPGQGGGSSQPPPPTCEQQLTTAIAGFLSSKGSSLAADAAEIVQVGQNDKIDPTLIAAIAIAENGQATNNPFALGPNGSSTYPNLDAAIKAVGSTLDKYIYTWNESTVSALWSGNTWKVDPRKPWITTQPPGYCVGTTAAAVAACQNTGTTIASFMQGMGTVATVGGNPNKLGFPCPD